MIISPQVSIALQLVETLSPDDLRDFQMHFNKLAIGKIIKASRKKEAFTIPPVHVLAAQALKEHRIKMAKRSA